MYERNLDWHLSVLFVWYLFKVINTICLSSLYSLILSHYRLLYLMLRYHQNNPPKYRQYSANIHGTKGFVNVLLKIRIATGIYLYASASVCFSKRFIYFSKTLLVKLLIDQNVSFILRAGIHICSNEIQDNLSVNCKL